MQKQNRKSPSNASSDNSSVPFVLRFGQNLVEDESGCVESRGHGRRMGVVRGIEKRKVAKKRGGL